MNREQLDEIRNRAGTATEGPWHRVGKSIQADVPLSDDGPSTTKWNTTVVCSVGAWGSGRPTEEDAEFIAHARQDVPALLAEIDRLQKRIDKAHDDLTRIDDGDTDEFTTFESTVAYVVLRYRALEKDFNELDEMHHGPGVSVASSSAGGHTECGTCGEELKAIGDQWWHAAPEGDHLPDHPAVPVWASDASTTAEGLAEGDIKGSSTGGVS